MTFDCRVVEVISSLLVVSAHWAEAQDFVITWPDDPEIKIRNDAEYPTTPGEYKRHKEGTESVVTLLAGRSEFPYLVDIRIDTQDQEKWAIGNLMSHSTVLTTCRWSLFYLREIRNLRIDQQKDTSAGIYAIYEPEIVVLYGPVKFERGLIDRVQHLWNSRTAKAKHGRRSVKVISNHPNCEENEVNYDFSVLLLSREIPPIIPYIGYMPIRIERNNLLITDIDLSRQEEQHIVCYVASVGRNYQNWKGHVAIDYKVKYRVYYETWSTCTNHYAKYKLRETCNIRTEDEPTNVH
uniref:DNA-directed RNA polymerase subunit beta n=2 Tax=Lygus hesperus TaxID=30085 RepID=A0A0A9W8F2_LYGHE